ncbi:hypothetical protein EIP91_005652, partial [Steccherinum ochraceum]
MATALLPRQPSILCAIPTTILESIALEAALLQPLGPPADLVPLLQTCRYIHHALALQHNRHLYAHIFRSMFDWRAASRRFGPRACYSSNLAVQLKKYCTTLRRLKHADPDSEHLNLDLWNAFLMMIENDGRNAAQLEWAGLTAFVDRLVRERLWRGREDFHGWPAENTTNALALWLMWFTTDQATIDAELATPEGQQRRLHLMDLVRPYVVTAIRYPSFHAPDNHFDFPLSPDYHNEFPYSLMTPHGFYPLYRQPNLVAERHLHFNIPMDIAPPLITVAAKLLYFSRSEAMEIQFPSQLPVDRAAALALHAQQYPNERPYPSPTQTDWREFNAHKGAKLVDLGTWDWRSEMTLEDGALEDDGVWRKSLRAPSAKWDHDWHRLTGCWNPWEYNDLKGVVYSYGTMHGLWKGRMLIPDITEYFALVTSATFPENFSVENPRMIMQPIYFYLREHHCINPALPVATGGAHDGFDEGVRNGWFPEFNVSEHNGVVRITNTALPPGGANAQNAWGVSRYETKAAEEEEIARRAEERVRRDQLSEEREAQAKEREEQEKAAKARAKAKGKGKRKRLAADGDGAGLKKKREAPQELEDSDALDYLPEGWHPRPRPSKDEEEGDEEEEGEDGEEDEDEEDAEDDAVSTAGTEPSSSTHTSTAAQSPAYREASLEEVRMTVDEAFGPEHNVDDILDEVMAEADPPQQPQAQPQPQPQQQQEEEGEEYEDDEVVPNVIYDDTPETFPDEQQHEHEHEENPGYVPVDEDYTEYIENTCNGIQDIIITGETIPRHGQAFHHFRFYGRVRRWDGLVAIVRVPTEYPRLGISIFRGYVTANKNWVGSWRAYTSNVRAIPPEGPFIASQVENPK